MDNENDLFTRIERIKKRLDLAHNYIMIKEYGNSNIQLLSGYIEYHNMLKDYKIMTKYLKDNERK